MILIHKATLPIASFGASQLAAGNAWSVCISIFTLGTSARKRALLTVHSTESFFEPRAVRNPIPNILFCQSKSRIGHFNVSSNFDITTNFSTQIRKSREVDRSSFDYELKPFWLIVMNMFFKLKTFDFRIFFQTSGPQEGSLVLYHLFLY